MFVNYRNPDVLCLELLEYGVIRVRLAFKLRYLDLVVFVSTIFLDYWSFIFKC